MKQNITGKLPLLGLGLGLGSDTNAAQWMAPSPNTLHRFTQHSFARCYNRALNTGSEIQDLQHKPYKTSPITQVPQLEFTDNKDR